MGRKQVAARCLKFLLDHPSVEVVAVLTDSHLSISPTAALAKQAALPLYEFDAALAAIRNGELEYDLGVSMLYWRKLRDEFLTSPDLGTVNFHPAPLPDYKGTAGYNMAIMDELVEWAVSAHYVDEEIDTGGIIEVLRFAIDPKEETARSLESKSMPMIYSLFVETLNRLLDAQKKLPTTINSGGIYITRPEMEAMKAIKPGDDIAKKIRAFWFPPYQGAYIEIDGAKYTLVDEKMLSSLADPSVSSLQTKPSE